MMKNFVKSRVDAFFRRAIGNFAENAPEGCAIVVTLADEKLRVSVVVNGKPVRAYTLPEFIDLFF